MGNFFIPNGAVFGASTKWVKENNTFYNESVTTFNMKEINSKLGYTSAEEVIHRDNLVLS